MFSLHQVLPHDSYVLKVLLPRVFCPWRQYLNTPHDVIATLMTLSETQPYVRHVCLLICAAQGTAWRWKRLKTTQWTRCCWPVLTQPSKQQYIHIFFSFVSSLSFLSVHQSFETISLSIHPLCATSEFTILPLQRLLPRPQSSMLPRPASRVELLSFWRATLNRITRRISRINTVSHSLGEDRIQNSWPVGICWLWWHQSLVSFCRLACYYS